MVPHSLPAELDRLLTCDVDRDWGNFVDGSMIWSLQTYLLLRSSGLPVTCSDELKPNVINLGHEPEMEAMRAREDAFLVSMQADYPRHGWAQLHVLQNQSQVTDERCEWIPVWPQPGLIPRDPSRVGVKCVAHTGRAYYLAGGEQKWIEALGKLACEFRLLNETRWNDRSQVDVIVAIRSFDRNRYDRKPPSKLIDAWHSGVPMIAGWDSAFEQIATPGIEYLRADSLDAAVEAIRRLQSDRELYDRLVQRGKTRAAEFSRDAVRQRWISFLTNKAVPHFRRWINRGALSRFAWRGRVIYSKSVRRVRGIAKSLIRR
ncbi:MAG TPA: glycosyltransferase [Tepidisphaeraceae bacterium]